MLAESVNIQSDQLCKPSSPGGTTANHSDIKKLVCIYKILKLSMLSRFRAISLRHTHNA